MNRKSFLKSLLIAPMALLAGRNQPQTADLKTINQDWRPRTDDGFYLERGTGPVVVVNRDGAWVRDNELSTPERGPVYRKL